MTQIHRSKHNKYGKIPATIWIFILLFVVVVFLALVPDDSSSSNNSNNNNNNKQLHDPASLHAATAGLGHKLRRAVQTKRDEIQHALQGLASSHLPYRLQQLRQEHQIIGERLFDIQQGRETAQEILNGEQPAQGVGRNVGRQRRRRPKLKNATLANSKTKPKKKKAGTVSDKPPMELNEIVEYLDSWIHQLHETLVQAKHATFEGIWQAYHDLTVKTLYPWDQEYLQRMPERREDGSIFLSLASYRDENCFHTIYNAYKKAKHPEHLFVGLTQQNCHSNCRSGVLSNRTMVEVPPDDDCYQLFCDSDIGKERCQQVRVLNIDEPESLGPYAARYFTSKMWYGESWFMQVDAHMTFAQDWDATSVEMLQKAPSKKPVLSHYPPAHTVDLEARANQPAARLCGPVFATSDLENQIIRLEGGGIWDGAHLDTPAFAPFTAAGYFVSHSHMLKEVPFDPFLPWIFMGEEIIMSSRLWTSGYDIFSPTTSVVGHIYVRRHKPKFWESVHRAFTNGVHNPLQMMILDRVKYQLGYPEAALDMLPNRNLLTAVESYTMGRERSLKRYLQMVGVNMTTKQVTFTEWCEKGYPPPGFEKHYHLYPQGMRFKNLNLTFAEDDGFYDDILPDDDGADEDPDDGSGEDADDDTAAQEELEEEEEDEEEEGQEDEGGNDDEEAEGSEPENNDDGAEEEEEEEDQNDDANQESNEADDPA